MTTRFLFLQEGTLEKLKKEEVSLHQINFLFTKIFKLTHSSSVLVFVGHYFVILANGGNKRRLGGSKAGSKGEEEGEEEFFCLSTEDVRSTPAIAEGPRTRNSSGVSLPRSRHTSTNSLRLVLPRMPGLA